MKCRQPGCPRQAERGTTWCRGHLFLQTAAQLSRHIDHPVVSILARVLDQVGDDLVEEVYRYLDARSRSPESSPDQAAALELLVSLGFSPQAPLTPDQVEAFRRRMARRHHPDRGGDPGIMAAVNGACDDLIKKMKSDPPPQGSSGKNTRKRSRA